MDGGATTANADTIASTSPAPTASQVGQALARFSVLHAVAGLVTALALALVLTVVRHGVASDDWRGVPFAAMGVLVTGLTWACRADTKVQCAQLGVPGPATTNRLLRASSQRRDRHDPTRRV